MIGTDGRAQLSHGQEDWIDARDKGVPPSLDRIPISEVRAQCWNVLRESLPLPAAVLKDTALLSNSKWMQRFVDEHGVAFAPHGKTTMAPALFDLQTASGAWGITVSTPHQVAVARAYGHKRIFIANQVLGQAGLEYLFSEIADDDDVEIHCLADSLDLVEQMERIGREFGSRKKLNVLVELGFEGGRTGCRSVEEGRSVAAAIHACEHLRLSGVEGFEGIVKGDGLENTLSAVRQLLGEVVELAECCDRDGLFDGAVLLSAGGTAFFDLVIDVLAKAQLRSAPKILLRSGCYISHDSVLFAAAARYMRARSPELFDKGQLTPAMEIWGYVQSRPEPDLAIIGIGKRDVGFDHYPVLERWYRPGSSKPVAAQEGHEVFKLDDQHCYLRIPHDSPLKVGDMAAFGISHPCLTFDKWRVIHVVNDEYDVISSMRTYF